MVTEYVSKAWKIYKKNAGSFILSELIADFLPLIVILIGGLLFLGTLVPFLNWEMITSTTNEEILTEYFLELFKNPKFVRSLISGLLYFTISLILGTMLSLYLNIGQIGMAYESLRKRTKIKTMFKVSKKFGFRWILTVFIMLVFVFLTLIPLAIIAVFTFGLGIIPVLLTFPIIPLIAPAMIIDNLSPFGSLKGAFKVAKKNYMSLLVLWLIYVIGSILISYIGTLASFIPMIGWIINLSVSLSIAFIVQPMMKISFVNFYKRNKK